MNLEALRIHHYEHAASEFYAGPPDVVYDEPVPCRCPHCDKRLETKKLCWQGAEGDQWGDHVYLYLSCPKCSELIVKKL